jgi:hypothetical protein
VVVGGGGRCEGWVGKRGKGLTTARLCLFLFFISSVHCLIGFVFNANYVVLPVASQ